MARTTRHRLRVDFATAFGFLVAAMTLAVLEPAAAESRTLSRPERAIVAHVDAHVGEARALLERVVNLNSGTQNLAGV